MRIFITLLTGFILAAACASDKTSSASKIDTVHLKQSSIDSLLNYVDNEVVVKGLVNHICRHSGKKMFLISPKDDKNLKCIPAEAIQAFDMELEGTVVTLRGVLKYAPVDAGCASEVEEECVKTEDLVLAVHHIE
jgi:hypothetical protein